MTEGDIIEKDIYRHNNKRRAREREGERELERRRERGGV